MLTWYVVQTNPLCERKAHAGLKEQGFTAFLPVETRWKRARNQQRERADFPLFTGYLFVGLGEWQSVYQVRAIDGVKGLVGVNGQPTAIPYRLDEDGKPDGHFVYDLQARQMAGEFDKTPAKRSVYHAGEKARILTGPFKGQIGKMLEADDAGRVRLMLEGLFAGGITIDDDHLEAA